MKSSTSKTGLSKLDSWGANIHTFVFTNHKNNRFQKGISNAEHKYRVLSKKVDPFKFKLPAMYCSKLTALNALN